MKSRARRSHRPPIRRGRPIHRNSRHSRRAGLGNPRTPIIHKVTLRISTITFELTGFVSIYHMELAKLLYNLNSIARLFSVSITQHYVQLGLVQNASNKHTASFTRPFFSVSVMGYNTLDWGAWRTEHSWAIPANRSIGHQSCLESCTPLLPFLSSFLTCRLSQFSRGHMPPWKLGEIHFRVPAWLHEQWTLKFIEESWVIRRAEATNLTELRRCQVQHSTKRILTLS